MSKVEKTVRPNLFKDFSGTLQVTVLREADINAEDVATFLSSATSNTLGVAASYGPKGVLSALVLSTETRCLRILLPSHVSKKKQSPQSRTPHSGRRLLQTRILGNPTYTKLAFDAERVSCGLFLDHRLHIASLVDAEGEGLATPKESRGSIARLLEVLGGDGKIEKQLTVRCFDRRLQGNEEQEAVVLRAWASWMVSIGQAYVKSVSTIPRIHTNRVDSGVLMALSKCVKDANQLMALKPTKVKNDVAAKFSIEKGTLNVTLQRYTTRMRPGERQHIIVETSVKGRNTTHSKGTVQGVKGKNAVVNLAMSQKDAASAKIQQIYTVGPENATNAEIARIEATLRVLQQVGTFFDHSLARRIYLGVKIPGGDHLPLTSTINYNGPLNNAQNRAVKHILSDEPERAITVVQGPPGTGKTTVVAASVTSMASSFVDGSGVWLVAHSNIAVKKIAEKLVDVGFHDFKLLVSFEFHFDWHDHLYHDVLEQNVIRGDHIPKNSRDTEIRLNGAKVILCSLSMFANPRIVSSGLTRLVPVKVVIVDEASQIEIGDYLPLFHIHGKDLEKLVFIGDDRQLAPFGQDDLGTLRSIFELPNVRKHAIFLDTQYRMPMPIGDFISRRVYANRLKSQHSIHDSFSCRFVDIKQGKEAKVGHSFKNVEEANYVVNIAKAFHKQGKSYRIITPYDGQRSYIENLLKSGNIPWEDRCFNVDSFQGNEADHVIISVVRTAKVGFLKNRRRSNVMLSRCKRSMTICTNRMFVNDKASGTLLGEMCAEWGSGTWLDSHDILAGRF